MGKFKYDAQKKANKAKKKQKKIELKEIKLRPVTEVHDYTFKIKNAQKFISKGDKVKFTIRFKGRELQHSHLGNELMDKIKQDMQEIGKVELHPKFDGKQMIMVIQPLQDIIEVVKYYYYLYNPHDYAKIKNKKLSEKKI